MRTSTIQRLLVACALLNVSGYARAGTNDIDLVASLSPSNADLIAVTPNCTLWSTTTFNPPPNKEHGYVSLGWKYWLTTYYVVGRGFAVHYVRGSPFRDESALQISPRGSILTSDRSDLTGGQILLMSHRDAEASTNADVLTHIELEKDIRNFDGWTFELEEAPSAIAEPSASVTNRPPTKVLHVTTRSKTGCRISLFDYSRTNVQRTARGDWQKTWPIRSLSLPNNEITIWDGRDWRCLRPASLTHAVGGIVIDYMYDDGSKHIRWMRLNYGLEDDGSRGVSKNWMYKDNIVSGYVHGSPVIPPLDEKGIRDACGIMQSLPPSTGEGLTNWTVRISDSGDPRCNRPYIRTYPCAAVPPKVMRLLDLMGGLQYEAKEILKEAPTDMENK